MALEGIPIQDPDAIDNDLAKEYLDELVCLSDDVHNIHDEFDQHLDDDHFKTAKLRVRQGLKSVLKYQSLQATMKRCVPVWMKDKQNTERQNVVRAYREKGSEFADADLFAEKLSLRMEKIIGNADAINGLKKHTHDELLFLLGEHVKAPVEQPSPGTESATPGQTLTPASTPASDTPQTLPDDVRNSVFAKSADGKSALQMLRINMEGALARIKRAKVIDNTRLRPEEINAVMQTELTTYLQDYPGLSPTVFAQRLPELIPLVREYLRQPSDTAIRKQIDEVLQQIVIDHGLNLATEEIPGLKKYKAEHARHVGGRVAGAVGGFFSRMWKKMLGKSPEPQSQVQQTPEPTAGVEPPSSAEMRHVNTMVDILLLKIQRKMQQDGKISASDVKQMIQQIRGDVFVQDSRIPELSASLVRAHKEKNVGMRSQAVARCNELFVEIQKAVETAKPKPRLRHKKKPL